MEDKKMGLIIGFLFIAVGVKYVIDYFKDKK